MLFARRHGGIPQEHQETQGVSMALVTGWHDQRWYVCVPFGESQFAYQGDPDTGMVLRILPEWVPHLERIQQVALDQIPTEFNLQQSFSMRDLTLYYAREALEQDEETTRTIGRNWQWETTATGLDCLLLFAQRMHELGCQSWEKLSLVGVNLSPTLPMHLRFMGNLRVLDISRTQIAILPPEISTLRQLEELDISDNPIWEIPMWLTLLPSLRIFKANHLEIQEPPLWITRCPKIEVFEVDPHEGFTVGSS